MKNLTKTFLLLICFSLPLVATAQNEPKDDSKYMAGAVPEVNGKVVFTKNYSIPGMSQEEIYNRILKWMEARLAKNENNSRVLYTNQEKGQIIGYGDEWIVFKSSALSLDRTKIIYQLTVTCQPEKCCFQIEKIRYIYQNGEEKYTAEEWITDKYALNKSKTKLVIGLVKWRRKTIDFIDDLGVEVAEALSANEVAPKKEEQSVEKPVSPVNPNETIVIAPKNQVISDQTAAQTTVTQTTVTPVPSTPVVTKSAPTSYKEVAPDQIPDNLIQMGAGRIVLVIGQDVFNQTTMTANAGGSIGKMSGKAVVFSFLSPDQPYQAMEEADTYTVRFYPNGQNEPSVILECKKLPSQTPLEGQPRMYIGEITKAQIK